MIAHKPTLALLGAFLIGCAGACATSQAVQVTDPSQNTDTGLEVASLALQGAEFFIAHWLSNRGAETDLVLELPDGGALLLHVVSETPVARVSAKDGGP